MDDYALVLEVHRREQTDEWFCQCRDFVDLYEPAYQAILETLTQAQQLQLDNYISACENLEHARLFISYQIGREGL